MMNKSQGIMDGSPSWERLRDGVPREIADETLRRIFHDYANVVTILVGQLDNALDEVARLHQRIDRRGADHEELKARLFDPDDGTFAKQKDYVDSKFGRFTGPLFVLIGSVMSGLILMAAQRLKGG